MAYRISELPAGTPPYLGSALVELSIVNGAMPSGYETKKALLSDVADMVVDTLPPATTFDPAGIVYGHTDGVPTANADLLRIDPTTRRVGIGITDAGVATELNSQLTLRASGPQWGRAELRLESYRHGSTFENASIYLGAPRSDTADGGAGVGRAFIVNPGNSVDTASALLLGVNTATAVVAGDAAAIRANNNAVEITSAGIVDFWRTSANYARIANSGNSYIALTNFGVRNTAPAAMLAIGTVAATAYTSNLATDDSNYERGLVASWSANVCQYGTTALGSGTVRDVAILRGGSPAARFSANGMGVGTLTGATEALDVSKGTAGHTLMRLLAYRNDVNYYNAGLYLSAPRGDAADLAAGGARGFLVTPGNSADNNASVFLGTITNAANGTAGATGDAATIRAGAATSLELSTVATAGSAAGLDVWRATVNGARLSAGNGPSWIGMGLAATGFALGVLNNNPRATLAIGTVGATAYTSNLATDVSNYERALIGNWVSNVAQFGTSNLGSGTARDVSFMRGGTERMRFTTGGITMPGLPTSNPAVAGQLWNNAGALSVSAG